MTTKLLIFESIDSGHRLQHPSFILAQFSANEFDELHLLVHSAFKSRHEEYFSQNPERIEGVIIRYMTIEEYDYFGPEKSQFLRPWRELRYVRAYIKINGISHLHLDNLNRFFYSLWALKGLKVTISCIYYAPYTRLVKPVQGLVRRSKFMLAVLRKKLQLKFALAKQNLNRIYILNDQWSVDYLNDYYKTTSFNYIVDPIWFPDVKAQSDPVQNSSKFHFLIFGTISKEKGIKQFLNGVALLSKECQVRMKIHIAGRVRPNYLSELEMLLRDLKSLAPFVEVVLENRFLSAQDMANCFNRCDIVVNMNIRTQSASGVMGHAAAWGKPAISSSTGLYGVLAKQYKLGPVVNPYNAAEVADACRSVVAQKVADFIPRRARKYVAERDWSVFGETVIRGARHLVEVANGET